MRLFSVSLTDFGAYFGQQVVDVSVNPGRPIVVFHGENMRGKTTFLNAIKWCLYGHVEDRLGGRVPRRDLINWKASAAGNWTMKVVLEFEESGSSYRLERHLQPRAGIQAPRGNQDFEELLFLEKDRNHLADPQAEVNQILPEDISRFFLFDGEMLGRYEELLADQMTQSSVVKDSIEDILGVPAVAHAIADLTMNRREATKRQATLGRQQVQSQVFASNAERLDAEVDALEESLSDLRQQLGQGKGKLDDLDDKLRATAGFEADAARLSQFREDGARLRQREQRLISTRRDLLGRAWQDVLQQHVSPRLAALEAKREEYIGHLRRFGELQSALSNVQKLIRGDACPVCGRLGEGLAIADLEQKKREIESDLAGLDIDDERFRGLTESIQRLRRLKAQGTMSTLAETERSLLQLRVDIADNDFRREELEERLRGHSSETIARNRIEARVTQREIVAIEEEIKKAELSVGEKRAEAEHNRSQIRAGADPALQRLNREVDLYRGLIEIFQKGLERLRDALKLTVETDASGIFRELSTDKSYSGLRINDNYGLRIIDSEGSEVTVRSAGAEQIVALALISALNRNAIQQGPVVMDTPLGRLDPGHRRNILGHLPELSGQVIILVHDGEVIVEDDLLDAIRDRVAREYEIAYASSRESQVQLRGR